MARREDKMLSVLTDGEVPAAARAALRGGKRRRGVENAVGARSRGRGADRPGTAKQRLELDRERFQRPRLHPGKAHVERRSSTVARRFVALDLVIVDVARLQLPLAGHALGGPRRDVLEAEYGEAPMRDVSVCSG